MASRQDPLCRASQKERERRPGGPNRWQLARTLAAQQISSFTLRLPDRLLPNLVTDTKISTRNGLTNRIAVYGPVRTVVWEGIRRKADPYPDYANFILISGSQATWLSWWRITQF